MLTPLTLIIWFKDVDEEEFPQIKRELNPNKPIVIPRIGENVHIHDQDWTVIDVLYAPDVDSDKMKKSNYEAYDCYADTCDIVIGLKPND